MTDGQSGLVLMAILGLCWKGSLLVRIVSIGMTFSDMITMVGRFSMQAGLVQNGNICFCQTI